MILNKIEDPRDRLTKARRWELVQFARANGANDITGDMPAPMIRAMLRSRGLTNIPAPPRPLGQINQPHPRKMYRNGIQPSKPAPAAPQPAFQPEAKPVVEVDAEADLARQWRQQSGQPLVEPPAPIAVNKPVDQMGFNELQKFCSAHNVPRARKENTETLREKVKAFLDG